jgi:SAM-dependent methyltransferase
MPTATDRLPLKLHAFRLLATLAVACAFRFRGLTRHRLFRAAMASIFGRLAPRYDAMWGRMAGGWEAYTAPLRQALQDPLVGEPPGRVLDVGCGTAAASRAVAERFAGVPIVGLDLSPAMLRQARLIWADRRPGLLCVAGDAASPPFAPGSFDLVVVMNAPPEPEAVRDVLAPGGRAVFAYSLPYTPVVRPAIRRRLAEAGFARAYVRPSGLGVLVIAHRDEGA